MILRQGIELGAGCCSDCTANVVRVCAVRERAPELMCIDVALEDVPPIRPSTSAKPWGRLLGFIVAFHFLVGLCWIVGMALWSGTYDIMGATLGYITLRRPTGYSIQGVWCYFVFVTIGLIWASSKVALLASGTQKLPDQAYQGDWVAAFCGTILYIFGSTTSLTLYVELRKQILIVRREVLDELSEYERIISNEPEIHDAADGEPMEPDQPQNRFPGTPFRVADECKDAPA